MDSPKSRRALVSSMPEKTFGVWMNDKVSSMTYKIYRNRQHSYSFDRIRSNLDFFFSFSLLHHCRLLPSCYHSMKRYKEWQENQQYFQHLGNLSSIMHRKPPRLQRKDARSHKNNNSTSSLNNRQVEIENSRLVKCLQNPRRMPIIYAKDKILRPLSTSHKKYQTLQNDTSSGSEHCTKHVPVLSHENATDLCRNTESRKMQNLSNSIVSKSIEFPGSKGGSSMQNHKKLHLTHNLCTKPEPSESLFLSEKMVIKQRDNEEEASGEKAEKENTKQILERAALTYTKFSKNIIPKPANSPSNIRMKSKYTPSQPFIGLRQFQENSPIILIPSLNGEGRHLMRLKIRHFEIFKQKLSQDEFTEMSLQVCIGDYVSTSQFIPVSRFQNHMFAFRFKKKMIKGQPEIFVFVRYHKGNNDVELGYFSIDATPYLFGNNCGEVTQKKAIMKRVGTLAGAIILERSFSRIC